MTTKNVQAIVDAKAAAGSESYLWLQSLAGDVILWPTEAASVDDDGKRAIGRWQLSPGEEDELIELGIVDEMN